MPLFEFTAEQLEQFTAFIRERNAQNWGLWPAPATWPLFEGMPEYALTQHASQTDPTGTITKATFRHNVRVRGRDVRSVGLGPGCRLAFPRGFARL